MSAGYNPQLENILQSISDAFVSIGKDWRYTFVNDKALQLMGKSKEALLGKTLWEASPNAIGTQFDEEYRKVMDQRVSASFQISYPRHNWLEARAYPHEDGIAVFYTDITKRKKAEEEIHALNQLLQLKVADSARELEALKKELESFSYSISHDLRAPLRAIHGYVNILCEEYADKFDDDGQRIAGNVMTNAKKMGQLIDNLLEFFRTGKKELEKRPVDMQLIVNSSCAEFARKDTANRIAFNIGVLPPAFADYAAIGQVWLNLISNAVKFAAAKEKVLIEIGCEEQQNTITYYVKDNGVGFDMRYYDKLFGIFQRLHSQTHFEGTGIGLAIAQRLIVKHGGAIWAEANVGEGAAFYFSLPKS